MCNPQVPTILFLLYTAAVCAGYIKKKPKTHKETPTNQKKKNIPKTQQTSIISLSVKLTLLEDLSLCSESAFCGIVEILF